jgi:SAM-dependent methyltransferase
MRDVSGPWDWAYRGPPPPWDIGRPQPAVVRLADGGAFRGRVLDAGCGTGENTLEIASRGLATWGIDGAPHAIAKARAKAAQRVAPAAATFLVADALELERLDLQFETVLDCGLFHTFDDDERGRYVASLASVMLTGGRLHVLCFSDLEPGGWGPRRITRSELEAAFRAGWRIVAVERERFATRLHDDGAHAWLTTVERL